MPCAGIRCRPATTIRGFREIDVERELFVRGLDRPDPMTDKRRLIGQESREIAGQDHTDRDDSPAQLHSRLEMPSSIHGRSPAIANSGVIPHGDLWPA